MISFVLWGEERKWIWRIWMLGLFSAEGGESFKWKAEDATVTHSGHV